MGGAAEVSPSAGGVRRRPGKGRRPSGPSPTETVVIQPPTVSDQQWMDHLQVAATKPGVVIPSRLAFLCLLLCPFLAWLLVVATGMLLFRELPKNKWEVEHLMTWFDVLVFRTLAGPALSFIPLCFRALATWGVGSTGIGVGPGGRPRAALHVGLRATLLPQLAIAYGVVTLTRMILYVGHLYVQASAMRAGSKSPVAYLSDHVLLGASIVACLNVEAVCAASDAVKLAVTTAGVAAWREVYVSASLVAAIVLSLVVSLDMHFTARYFHKPAETAVALLAGAAMFNVPLLLWIRRQRIV